MKKEILRAISKCSTFSFETIEDIYSLLKSYDQTLLALQLSAVFNISIYEAATQIKKFRGE